MGTMVNSLPLNSGFGSSNLPLPTKCPDGGIGIHEGLKIPWTLSPCKFDPCSGYLAVLRRTYNFIVGVFFYLRLTLYIIFIFYKYERILYKGKFRKGY